MKLATLKLEGTEVVCIVTPYGYAPIHWANLHFGQEWHTDIWHLLQSGALEDLRAWYDSEGWNQLQEMRDRIVPPDQADLAPLYRHPRKKPS